MKEQPGNRLLTLVLLALAVSCADLWVKDALPTPAWAIHQRSLVWALGCWAILAAVLPLARIPSTAVTVGAGFLAGGVLGNLISAGTDHLAVPNPLFFRTDSGGLAFNVADASILIGNVVLMIALSELVIRHRDRLPRWHTRPVTAGPSGGREAPQERQRP